MPVLSAAEFHFDYLDCLVTKFTESRSGQSRFSLSASSVLRYTYTINKSKENHYE